VRQLVIGNFYSHTCSNSVDHGGHFDIYFVGLGYKIKISIFGPFGYFERSWAPARGWKILYSYFF